jgi:hypothetical protein
MRPHDLTPIRLPLPAGDRDSAVLLSGTHPRHLRLGYLLQRRFPGLLRRWWACPVPADLSRRQRLTALAAALHRRVRARPLRRLLQLCWRWVASDALARVEQRMFADELETMSSSAAVHPTTVASFDAPALLAALDRVSPYFVLAFGGPPPGARLVAAARGLAINQHTGWSPAAEGALTIETALYHRRLEWIGNTVHLLDGSAAPGAILRRSTAALHPDDSVADCVLAVTALGNELVCEVLAEALTASELEVFFQRRADQPVRALDHAASVRQAITRDFARGWFADALAAARSF